jgi:putative transposase
VIQRGNNRSAIFAGRDDYRVFYEYLATACDQHGCSVHAYVLMTNHVHLLITPGVDRALSSMMQALGRRYVRYFNDCHRRTGTLWEGRYRASLIDSERYLLTCYRYVELNPVRARQVTRPEHYDWSSYRANALGLPDPLITAHERYVSLGADDESRCEAYRALFLAPVDIPSLSDIRESTWKGWPLGDARFRDEVTMRLKRPVGPLVRGGDRRSETYRREQPSQNFKRL